MAKIPTCQHCGDSDFGPWCISATNECMLFEKDGKTFYAHCLCESCHDGFIDRGYSASVGRSLGTFDNYKQLVRTFHDLIQ